MGSRLVASFAVSFAVLYTGACSAFDPAPASEGPTPDAAPSETSDVTEASVDCDGGCVLFRDDFERTGDVKGPWTTIVGADSLSLAKGQTGTALLATQKAATGPELREAMLSTALTPRAGLRMSVHIGDLTANAAEFGQSLDDYCEIAGVSLGEDRIAIVYYSVPTDLDVWLYGLDERGGDTANINASSANGADVDLTLTWGADTVTVEATIAGVNGVVTRPLKPGLAGAVPTVDVGLRCGNETGAISVKIDDVVVRALP